MTNNLKVSELFMNKKTSNYEEKVNLKITRVDSVSKAKLPIKGSLYAAITSDDTNLILDVMNCLLKESNNE